MKDIGRSLSILYRYTKQIQSGEESDFFNTGVHRLLDLSSASYSMVFVTYPLFLFYPM